MTSLLGTMSPTITMVEGMMGCWQSISEDLNSIAEAVKADSAAVNAVVERIIEAKIAEKWNTLAEAGAFIERWPPWHECSPFF